jgi:hypothetical protein
MVPVLFVNFSSYMFLVTFEELLSFSDVRASRTALETEEILSSSCFAFLAAPNHPPPRNSLKSHHLCTSVLHLLVAPVL